jgi:hypothetical protein
VTEPELGARCQTCGFPLDAFAEPYGKDDSWLRCSNCGEHLGARTCITCGRPAEPYSRTFQCEPCYERDLEAKEELEREAAGDPVGGEGD